MADSFYSNLFQAQITPNSPENSDGYIKQEYRPPPKMRYHDAPERITYDTAKVYRHDVYSQPHTKFIFRKRIGYYRPAVGVQQGAADPLEKSEDN